MLTMESIQEYVSRCREWQKKNDDWELVCDIEDSEKLYVQWHELPKAERMSWIGKYGTAAKSVFEQFANKQCKVEKKVLSADLRLCDSWPPGNAMTVYRIRVDGIPAI